MPSKYFKSKYTQNTYDVDSEELLNCIDMGYKEKEIATELKLPVSEIQAFTEQYFN